MQYRLRVPVHRVREGIVASSLRQLLPILRFVALKEESVIAESVTDEVRVLLEAIPRISMHAYSVPEYFDYRFSDLSSWKFP